MKEEIENDIYDNDIENEDINDNEDKIHNLYDDDDACVSMYLPAEADADYLQLKTAMQSFNDNLGA